MCMHKFRAFTHEWKTVYNSHFCYLKVRTLKIRSHFLMKTLMKTCCYTIVFGNKLHESIRALIFFYFLFSLQTLLYTFND